MKKKQKQVKPLLSIFRTATIKRMLAEDPEMVAVASLPELQMEMIGAHGIPAERTGLLYCISGIQVAMMRRDVYEGYKAKEGKLIGGKD